MRAIRPPAGIDLVVAVIPVGDRGAPGRHRASRKYIEDDPGGGYGRVKGRVD